MKMQKLALGLTLINFAVLLVSVGHAKSPTPPEVTPILRTQAFELVDQRGQVRSRLNVEADGTVVLRLLDEEGTIRVKLGADKSGSGLVLLDEATEPGVHIIARRKGNAERPATRIILKGADGQRLIEP
jgi:hypothetical protein